MQYTSKTTKREVVGPFTGKRFPSMSDDVVEAMLTVDYRFENFSITVIGIPARWDRITGAEFVTGTVGREVLERVATLAAMLENQRHRPAEQIAQAEGRLNRAQIIAEMLRVTPLRLSVNLPHAA